MAATIKMGGEEHIINDELVWSGKFSGVLNAAMQLHDAGGEDPNPPLTAALAMAERFGAELVDYDEYDFDPEAIY